MIFLLGRSNKNATSIKTNHHIQKGKTRKIIKGQWVTNKNESDKKAQTNQPNGKSGKDKLFPSLGHFFIQFNNSHVTGS